MKNLKRFKTSEPQSLFSIKGGGATSAEKTSTVPNQTREWKNDKDSNAPMEGQGYSTVFLPVEP
jgi:hypothetical protein